MSVTVRFAPSPTGLLHVGNARTVLLNWLFARKEGGRVVLRIDDTDRQRARLDYEAAILEDLRWLELDWDYGVRQSERAEVYGPMFSRLRSLGRAYPCYESPDELRAMRDAQRARGRPPRYDRTALQLSRDERDRLEAAGRMPHWRFRLTDGEVEIADRILGTRRISLATLSDPVVCRADGVFTYVFASVVDDADLSVTDVIRGQDHVTSAAIQHDLDAALDLPVPHFAHLPLVLADDGSKLSKRTGSSALRDLRAEGVEPMAVLAILAALGTGRAPEMIDSPGDLVAQFDLDDYGRAPPRLDLALLDRLSTEVLRRLPFDQVRPRLEAQGMHDVDEAFWLAIRDNIERIDDALEWWRIVREPVVPMQIEPEFLASAAVLLPPQLKAREDVEAWLEDVSEVTGRRGKTLYLPIRLAVSAREHGPDLKLLLALIGRDRIYRRLVGDTA